MAINSSPPCTPPRTILRETTNAQTRRSLEDPTPKKSRKILNIHETASQIRGEHDCNSINVANTVEKVRTRFFFSLTRFVETVVFNCINTRGTTAFNGSSAPCQGRCHAGHATFTSKKYDDICDVVRRSLHENCFSQLDPAHSGYLTQRFNLSEKEVQHLNSENQQDRLVTFDHLASILTPHEKRLTFSGTSYELQRAAVTFENPKNSNDVDSSADRKMRLLEDQLNEECRLGTKTPITATLKLQESYHEFLTNTIRNLNTDLNNLDNLQGAWNTMIACQKALQEGITDEAFEAYLNAVDGYLAAHKARFINPKPTGTPSLKGLALYLKNTQCPAVLRELQANRNATYFELSEHHLQIPTDSEEQFTIAITKVEGRLSEAYYQLSACDLTEKDLKTMLKYGFGKKNEDDIVVTPDKTALTNALVELIPKAEKAKVKRDRDGDFIRIF